MSATAVALKGSSVAISGLVTDGGSGTVSLIASGGTISESGSVIAGTLSGSSTGATSLTGSNTIATLGTFTASGFTLNDSAALTVSGVVNGGTSASITDTALLTIQGTVSATAIALKGSSVAISGLVTDGGSGTVSLIATGGTISEGGSVIAGTLSGSSTGATGLTGSNTIGTLGTFTASGFTLNDGIPLSVNGILSGGASATIQDTGLLTVAGTISAAAIALKADNITIPGVVSDGGSGTVSLIATTGTIAELGTLIAGTLSGSAQGAANLIDAVAPVMSFSNKVGTLGSFSAAGFTLNDGVPLVVSGVVKGGALVTITDTNLMTITGTVTAGAVNLTAGSLAISGLVTDGGAGTVTLITTAGTINETGTLISGTLRGSAAGAVVLAGSANAIATLGSFSVAPGNGFALNDSIDLLVAGPLSASRIAVTDTLNAVTLLADVTLLTDGIARPSGQQTLKTLPTAQTQDGAYFQAAAFTQVGTATVGNLSGASNILRIDSTGTIGFAPAQAGLEAKNTWLILGLSGTGVATGNISVSNFDFAYTGTAGSASLTGVVSGLVGQSAATASYIDPSSSANFRLNNCPIHSVNCVLLPIEGAPVPAAFQEIQFGSPYRPDSDDGNLLLPIVSDSDKEY